MHDPSHSDGITTSHVLLVSLRSYQTRCSQAGEALYLSGVASTRLFVSATVFTSCCATGAAVLHADSGGVQLSNGTLFLNVTGAAMFVGAANVIYLLPAPAGRYLLSASKCEVAWWPCSVTQCHSGCGVNDINLDPYSQPEGCDSPRPPYYLQSCPWSYNISSNALGPGILGRQLQTIPPGALEFSEYPIPCAPGIRGASADELTGQTSPLCAGFCDPGFFCPTYATVDPIPCPRFAPAFTLVALLSERTPSTKSCRILTPVLSDPHPSPVGSSP